MFTFIDEQGNEQQRYWDTTIDNQKLLGGYHACLVGKSGAGKTHLSQQIIDIPWIKTCTLILSDGNGRNTLRLPDKVNIRQVDGVPETADAIREERTKGTQCIIVDSIDASLRQSVAASLEESEKTKRGNSKGSMHHHNVAHEHMPRLITETLRAVQSNAIIVSMAITKPVYEGPLDGKRLVGYRPSMSENAADQLMGATCAMWHIEQVPTSKVIMGEPVEDLQDRSNPVIADWDNIVHVAHTRPGCTFKYAKTRVPINMANKIPRVWQYPSLPRIIYGLIMSRKGR